MSNSSILIVDDDPAIRSDVSALLTQSGYRVDSVATGSEALNWCDQHRLPHLIVLDVMLPGIDGYTVCQRVRQLPTYVPILMLSVRDEVHDKLIGLELGADDYVTRPFVPIELVARVKALLRLAQHTTVMPACEEEPLACGSLKVWRAQHRVTVAGRDIQLSPKEWQVLVVLMEHVGQVIGRETLLRRVWGDDISGDTRVVDAQVQRLRAKIKSCDPDYRCIQAVRGFGYRLVCP